MACPSATRHARPRAVVTAVALLLAACGGSAQSMATATPPATSAPPVSEVPTPKPTTTPEPPAPPSPSVVASVPASARASAVAATELDWRLEPNYGSVELTAGFTPDPHEQPVVSGGPIDVSYLGDDCVGFATAAPDYDVTYEAGSMTLLRFYFIAETAGDDTTLVINAPDGTWHCNDDANAGTLDPMIDFTAPQAGLYDIWIGSYSGGASVNGTLFVTELPANHP